MSVGRTPPPSSNRVQESANMNALELLLLMLALPVVEVGEAAIMALVASVALEGLAAALVSTGIADLLGITEFLSTEVYEEAMASRAAASLQTFLADMTYNNLYMEGDAAMSKAAGVGESIFGMGQEEWLNFWNVRELPSTPSLLSDNLSRLAGKLSSIIFGL